MDQLAIVFLPKSAFGENQPHIQTEHQIACNVHITAKRSLHLGSAESTTAVTYIANSRAHYRMESWMGTKSVVFVYGDRRLRHIERPAAILYAQSDDDGHRVGHMRLLGAVRMREVRSECTLK